MILLVAAALAEEPVVAEPAPADAYEIVVVGESAIRAARAELVRDFEGAGWRARERGADVVFRPPKPWMGRARLGREGTLVFGRPVVAAGSTRVPETTYATDLERNDVTGMRAETGFWLLPSTRLLERARAEALVAVGPSLQAYRDTYAGSRFDEGLQKLPARLDALWSEGAALGDGPPLATPGDRRAAVLELWATRADTPEGEAVRRAVEAWLGAVVQASPHPVTAEERRAAEAAAGRPLKI